jgi:altronate hydrolase
MNDLHGVSTPVTHGASVRLAVNDNVVVAIRDVAAGEPLEAGVTAKVAVANGHKIASTAIRAGERVLRYGQVIGMATADIEAGDHVHSHNLAVGAPSVGLQGARSRVEAPQQAAKTVYFQGYRRANGRAGTRNHIGVLASVNCSSTVVHALIDNAKHLLLPMYPHVDGLVPIAHQSGCGMARDDLGFKVLDRTMKGFLNHPNFGAVLVIGLGCEVAGSHELVPVDADPQRYARFDIQQVGGTSAAIEAGLAKLEQLLAVAERDRRESINASELIVGLQCGGSDGLSGVTANPAMGMAVDELVAAGGTALLSETPEIFGAEHLLTARAETPDIADKLCAKIAWWLQYAERNDIGLDNNPSPGNKQGGLTTILEKSLGAVAKGGQSALRDVIDYAEHVRSRGLVFMDSPGFDPCSATGQVASGANMLLFSTGRGSCFGCKPTPSIKLATNSDLYGRMTDDMDIDCGRILSGVSMREVAEEIFQKVLAVASGQKSKSEMLGYGDHEFVPWRLGAVL